MIKRSLAATLRQLAKQYPVITLTGPWQLGKTTLVRSAFPRSELLKNYFHRAEEPDLFFWRGLVRNPAAPAALIYAGDRPFRRDGVTIYRWSDL